MKNKIIILFLMVFVLFNCIVVQAADTSDPNETCVEGTNYYNFYLFNETLTGTRAEKSDVWDSSIEGWKDLEGAKNAPTINFAHPYNYFENNSFLYTIQAYGAIPITASTGGNKVSGGSATVSLDSWNPTEWYNYLNKIYKPTSGYSQSNIRHAVQTGTGSNVIRFIVAGNSAKSQFCRAISNGGKRCKYVNWVDAQQEAYRNANYIKDFNTPSYIGLGDGSSFVDTSPTTWIVLTNGNVDKNGNANDALGSGYYKKGQEFVGTKNNNLKFKIYRNYPNLYNPFSTLSGTTIDKKKSTIIPAVFYIRYTCRKPCDSSKECCFDQGGTYHSNYSGNLVDNYKVLVKNERAAAAGKSIPEVYKDPLANADNIKQSTITAGVNNGTYLVKSCGCDPYQACCFEKNGNNYVRNKRLTGKNINYYKYVLDYGDDAKEKMVDPDFESGGTYVTCGCDPNKQCCYNSSGVLQKDVKNGGYTLVDPNNASLGVVKCSSTPSAVKATCDKPNIPATYDEVSGSEDDSLKAIIQGFLTHSGFSALGTTNKYPAINPGYDVTCKDSYKIYYPGTQRGNRDTEERWFVIKDSFGKNNIAKIEVNRICVTSPLANSALRIKARDALKKSEFILDGDVLSEISFKYSDIDDITNETGTAKLSSFSLKHLKKSSSTSIKYYYYYSSALPKSPTGTVTSISDNIAKNSYYMKRVDTVTYEITVPDIYVRGARGDATLVGKNALAKFPTGALPIKITTPAKNNYYNYKIVPKFSSASLNRAKITGNRNYSNSSTIKFDNNVALSEYSCTYDVVNTPGNPQKVFYRTISLSDINPHNRSLGMNWEYKNATGKITASSTKTEKLRKIYGYKAKTLAGKISNNSDVNSVFYVDDNDYSKMTNTTYKPVFSFTLDPVTMKRIRAYNDKRSLKGGYNDDDLSTINFVNIETEEQYKLNNRFKQQSNSCGWHAYSAFLACLYYGGNYCSNPQKQIVASGCEAKYYQENPALASAFNGYTPINNTKYDLAANRKTLIRNQNQADNSAYKAAGGT